MALAIGLPGMPWWHGTLCLPSMIFLHWKGVSLVVLARSSMKSVSLTVSHSRSGSGIFLHCCWRRCMPHSMKCWTQGRYVPANHHGLRFCVDFCRLNVPTKKDSYPLLHIQEALESMADATHFSMMDFKSRFWQVKMALESHQYTAFTVSNLGFYKFTCMPFGL